MCVYIYMKVKVKSLSHVRLFATLWIVAHGIFQARVLEWVASSFSRGSSWPRDQTRVFCIAGRGFNSEPPGKPYVYMREPQNTEAKMDRIKRRSAWFNSYKWNFITHSQLIDRTTRHKMTKDTEDMNNY